MSCSRRDDVYQSVAGALDAEQLAALSVHLETCEACAELHREVLALTGSLPLAPHELTEGGVADEVMTLIRLDRAQPRPLRLPRAAWAVPAVALAAAACLLLVLPHLTSGESPGGGFRARGERSATNSQWVSIEAYRVTSEGNRPLGAEMEAHDAIAFRYLNRAPAELKYLAILALDGAGRVHWYYPGAAPGEELESVQIFHDDEPHTLPDAVRQPLEPGPLRFFALFTARPLRTSEIERRVEADFAAAQRSVERLSQLGIDDAGQHSFLVRVSPARQAP
jgi:hypothetical protein